MPAQRPIPPNRTLGLICRHCGHTVLGGNIAEICGLYMVHAIRKHWEYIEILRDATDEEITTTFAFAKLKGMI
jgi:hypothetical protein